MQPLDRKHTNNRETASRAKAMLKRDAGWLPGYPLYVQSSDAARRHIVWRTAEGSARVPSEAHNMCGEKLRAAKFTITKLRKRFPKALAKVVEDVDEWLMRVDYLLENLKGTLHSGRQLDTQEVLRDGPLPRRWSIEFIRLSGEFPQLKTFLDAVAYSTLSGPRSPSLEPLNWIAENAGFLCRLFDARPQVPAAKSDRSVRPNGEHDFAFELAMLLYSVRDKIPVHLLPRLLAVFTDADVCSVRWKGVTDHLMALDRTRKRAQKQHEVRLPNPPTGETLGQLTYQVLKNVCMEKTRVRRNGLQRLTKLLSASVLEVISTTHRQINRGERLLEREVRRLTARHQTHAAAAEVCLRNRAEIAAATSIASEGQEVIAAFGLTLGSVDPNSGGRGVELIDAMPDFAPKHEALKLRLIEAWGKCWVVQNDMQQFLTVLSALSNLVRRRGVHRRLLQHWHEYLHSRQRHTEFTTSLSDELCSVSKASRRAIAVRTVRLLESTVYDHDAALGYSLMSSLGSFARASEDEETTREVVLLLSEHEDVVYSRRNVASAFQYGESPRQIANILAAFQRDPDLVPLAEDLSGLASDSELKRVLAKRFAAGDATSLSQLAVGIRILDSCGVEPKLGFQQIASKSDSQDWISRYPPEFEVALVAISSATECAEQIATKVLGKWFPSSAELVEQIETLQREMAKQRSASDKSRMQIRLNNLKCRLENGTSTSPGQQAKLIAKLGRRRDTAILDQLTEQCITAAKHTVRKQLQLDAIPEELLKKPLDRVLSEVIRLSGPTRQLGLKLLFKYLRRSTRELESELKNIAFRRRMESAGINMRPWQDDQLRVTARNADGKAYELAFTRNVSDFFLMGYHFDTCLAPDSFNFFSTIANAVDLNKRVVYGKTAEGKIVGRCLFALNDSGEILTYYRYSHKSDDRFDVAVDAFAKELASQMRTSIGISGKVSKLVAKEWYDDGPWGDNLDWLGQEGCLSKLLGEVEPQRVVPSLIDQLGVNVIKRSAVRLITDSRINHRREIVESLLDRFGPSMTKRDKFTIAVNTKFRELQEQLFAELGWRDIVRIVRLGQCRECGLMHGVGANAAVFKALIKYDPTIAIRAIRAARPSSIKRDSDDTNAIRRKALANAHGALGRETLARRLAEVKR